MLMTLVEGRLLATSLSEIFEPSSIVFHLIALVILTVGLYLLLFRPVKRMIKQRQEKIRKIEKENADLNEEVKEMKSSIELVLSDAKKEAAVIQENAVKVANQKADDIVASARRQAKSMVERTEQEMEEEYRKLQEDIEAQIADVSLAVAEKVLGRKLTPEDDKKLIEECLAKWSKE